MMGWIKKAQPRFFAVQAEGCAPVVKAWSEGAQSTTLWENPVTHAAGLRVPGPFAGRQMLSILRETGGGGWAVTEGEIVDAQRLIARLEGIWTSPEGAATVAALIRMKNRRQVDASTRVIVVFTGAGIKAAAPSLPSPVHLEGDGEEVFARVKQAIGV